MLPALFYAAREQRPVFGPGGRLSPFRAPFEFYPTPPAATRALLAAETFDGGIWEPACGNGAISKELEVAGYTVTSTDLVDHGYGRHGIDFLTQRLPRAKHIVTNPPYGNGLADDFVRKALDFTRHTGGRVAMLLNIASLCHPDRHPRFTRRPPSVIYALDECVCWPQGQPRLATRHTLNHRYAWLLWEPDGTSSTPTTFRWLTTRPYADAPKSKRNSTERTST